MRKFYFAGALLLLGIVVQAQNLTGAQYLRNARTLYDQGRLHELPTLLDNAFSANAFSSDVEKVEAYKLLVLTYIYLEEPGKADENMLKLLETDHFFKPIASDQVEFKNLYNKFRTTPIFSIGLKAGLNYTFVNVMKNYFIDAESAGYGEYTPNLGVNISATFEIQLRDNQKKFRKNFTINPEITYAMASFNYLNDRVYINDYRDNPATPEVDPDENVASVAHKITQTRIQVNMLAQYRLSERKLNPYVFGGPSLGYLMSSSFEGLKQFDSRGYEVASTVDNTASYQPLNISFVAGAGIKYKMGSIYVTGDVRYQYGFFNIVNDGNRREQTPENIVLQDSYGYVDNDFSIQQAMFHVGIIYPYFKPKKMIR